jgi:Xaa-Pro aminopeptidase
MAEHGLDDYLVPSSDEHLNEYLPHWRRRREFLSGFTGSAGDLVVGRNDAWLYADGRYHLQAEIELSGSTIDAMKLGTPGSRPVIKDLVARATAHPGHVVGIDPMVVPVGFAEELRRGLEDAGARLVGVPGNLVDPQWSDRPDPATRPLMALPLQWAGVTAADKVRQIRDDIAATGAESLVVVKLDQIAWLLNLRSFDDVPFNPVFEAFLYLNRDGVHLFLRTAATRIPGASEVVPGIQVHPYDTFPEFLSGIRGTVLVDPGGVTLGVTSALQEAGCTLKRAPSPIEERKAIKNEREQEAMVLANLRASLAKTRALLWLRRQVQAGQPLTEAGFRDHIEALYAEQPDYYGLSFNTIAATGPHGAIIHYGACDDTPLEEGHLFLIDSGAHIAGGTTDDTRTVAVGTCDDEARRIYTLVLKGHINAARQLIPDGSTGACLDTLARAPLWRAHLNYDHGTGHGVGAFLCVHEGPFGLSERERRPNAVTPLRAGIVSSIEPGYYRPGWGGVRLENLYLYRRVEPDAEGGRAWLALDPLTFIPFDTALIDDTLLEPEERAWLTDYHGSCLQRLSPHLPEDERQELREMVGR